MSFKWPTKEDYDIAMKDLEHTGLDSELRRGRITEDILDNAGIRRFGGGGLYSTTYQVTTAPSTINPTGVWMVRCFCKTHKGTPPSDIRERYTSISAFCQKHYKHASALLPVVFVERGLQVEYIDYSTNHVTSREVIPIVKMPFIKALSLGSFVAAYHEKPAMIEKLCKAWLHMIRSLEDIKMAHGDLDLTNVLVLEEGSELTLKLIDYDNVWISTLHGYVQTEFGHEGFQHPHFVEQKNRPYNMYMDRFSALSTYISLRALTIYPNLYKEWKADDTHQLLFSKEDYLYEMKPSETNYRVSHITQLVARGIYVLSPYLDELQRSLRECYIPCRLDDILPPPPQVIGSYDTPNTPPPQVKSWDSQAKPSSWQDNTGTEPASEWGNTSHQEYSDTWPAPPTIDQQQEYSPINVNGSSNQSSLTRRSNRRWWIIALLTAAVIILVLLASILYLVFSPHALIPSQYRILASNSYANLVYALRNVSGDGHVTM